MRSIEYINPQLLNVVVIAKTNLTTGRSAKVLLFSDDLELAYDKLIDYYQLRFQIEFNFRDAKQYWGLEDFMNVNEIQVSNAANFSLFMVTFSKLLLSQPQLQDMNIESMLDLKTVFRARKYTRRIIDSLGINAEQFLIDNRIFEAAEIGRIYAKAASLLAKVLLLRPQLLIATVLIREFSLVDCLFLKSRPLFPGDEKRY